MSLLNITNYLQSSFSDLNTTESLKFSGKTSIRQNFFLAGLDKTAFKKL